MLRKQLYDKTEYPSDHELMGIEHLKHCYDALRQSLMCSVDLTPLPWKWDEEQQEAKEVAQAEPADISGACCWFYCTECAFLGARPFLERGEFR